MIIIIILLRMVRMVRAPFVENASIQRVMTMNQTKVPLIAMRKTMVTLMAVTAIVVAKKTQEEKILTIKMSNKTMRMLSHNN